MPKEYFLGDLSKMLESVATCQPPDMYSSNHGHQEIAQDLSLLPFIWVSEYDHTDKFGLCYQLSDNRVGVDFFDSTHLILSTDGEKVQYIDKKDKEYDYAMDDYPEELNRKINFLKSFKDSLKPDKPRPDNEYAQTPRLRSYFYDFSAIGFHLTNGTFQVDRDGPMKMILCPIWQAVLYIDYNNTTTVYTIPLLKQFGCPEKVALDLKYAKTMVDKLYKKNLHSTDDNVSNLLSRLMPRKSKNYDGPYHSYF